MESSLPILVVCVCLVLGGVIAFRLLRARKRPQYRQVYAKHSAQAQKRSPTLVRNDVARDPISGQVLTRSVPMTIRTRKGLVTFRVDPDTKRRYKGREKFVLAAIQQNLSRQNRSGGVTRVQMGSGDDGLDVVDIMILYALLSDSSPSYAGSGFQPHDGDFGGGGASSGWSSDDRTSETDRYECVTASVPDTDRYSDYSAPDTRTADTGGHQSNDHDFAGGGNDDSD